MIINKALIVTLFFPFACSAVDFEDVARVIKVEPKTASFNKPVQVCDQTATPTSQGIGGAIVGAIAGGLIGGQVGKGKGRAVGAAVGAGTGAIVGNNIQNNAAPGTVAGHTNCHFVDNFQTIITGYQISYDWRGQIYLDFIVASQNIPPPASQPGDIVKIHVKLSPHS